MAVDRNERVNWPKARLRRIRAARRLLGFGGLVLASAFFMPAVEGCGDPVVPAGMVWDELDDGVPSAANLAEVFLWFIAAYLFGLVCLIIALRSRSYRLQTERSLGISVPFIFGTVVVLLGCAILIEVVWKSASWDTAGALFATITLLSMMYFMRSLRMGVSGLLCLRWYTSLCCILWFGYWLLAGLFGGGRTYYGLWLSLFGSACILTATFVEARSRSPGLFWETAGKLLSCRLRVFDLGGPRCFACGYLLIGLPRNRCPECGREFDPAEYGDEVGRAVSASSHVGKP
jgi:hypothetical protein